MEGKAEKQTIHLISYYSKQDIDSGKLQRPSESDLNTFKFLQRYGQWYKKIH